MTQEIMVDLAKVPWEPIKGKNGVTYMTQMGLNGSEGPELVRLRAVGHDSDPHYHTGAQFQIFLDGYAQFPDFRLEAVGVHYTDHNVPYGPFNGDHDMIVIHAKPAGRRAMKEVIKSEVLRQEINRAGRQFHGSANNLEWEPTPGHEGARRKVLIPESVGVSAQIVACPPGTALPETPAPYGRYEFVIAGTAIREGNHLGPECVRFVCGAEQPVPLVAGAEGATFLVVTFDEDAAVSYGGGIVEDMAKYSQSFQR
jgi:hypothetical protein